MTKIPRSILHRIRFHSWNSICGAEIYGRMNGRNRSLRDSTSELNEAARFSVEHPADIESQFDNVYVRHNVRQQLPRDNRTSSGLTVPQIRGHLTALMPAYIQSVEITRGSRHTIRHECKTCRSS